MWSYLVRVSIVILTIGNTVLCDTIDFNNNTTEVINKLKIPQNPELVDALSLLHAENFFRIHSEGFQTLINDTCGVQLVKYIRGIRNREQWAVKMLDASSKMQSGIFKGNVINLGTFDECIAIEHRQDNTEIRGRHCMLTLEYPWLWIVWKPSTSICLPAACEARHIQMLLNSTIKDFPVFRKLGIEDATATCTRIEPKQWTFGGILTVILFLSIVAIASINTICDVFDIRLSNEYLLGSIEGISKFSLFKNLSKLFDINPPNSPLQALHGIRIISMIWVLVGHEFLTTLAGAYVNSLDIMEWAFSWSSLIILLGIYAVDTFFMISGLLVTYSFVKSYAKNQKIDLFKFYLNRYLRLTPLLLAVTLATMFFVPRLGSGAKWDTNMDLMITTCETKWWAILLYVQNFFDPLNACMGHTWYLAVDMQLYWMSPLILYPLVKKPNLSGIIFGTSLIASLVIPGIVIYINQYQSLMYDPNLSFDDSTAAFTHLYIMPYNRAGPYVVGMIFGYLMAADKTQLSRKLIWSYLSGSVTVFLLICLCYKAFSVDNVDYNLTMEIIFNVFTRPLWGLFSACIIYATSKNYAGPISRFLSLPIFMPLSRVSYCFYLVHIIVQLMVNSSLRTAGYFSTANMITSALSTFTIATIISIVFTVLFESPIIALTKMFSGETKTVKSE